MVEMGFCKRTKLIGDMCGGCSEQSADEGSDIIASDIGDDGVDH